MKLHLPALGLVFVLLSRPLACGEVPNLKKLPDWAQTPAREALMETPPPDAEAWVLLMRREVTYAGEGSLRVRTLRLVQVIKGKGLEEAYYREDGLQEGRVRLVALKGWNLKPGGELVKLEAKDKIVYSERGEATIDPTMAAAALLPRVEEGSLVAFEAIVETKAQKDPWVGGVMEPNPVRRWEVQVSSPLVGVPAEVRKLSFPPWLAAASEKPDGTLSVTDVPALPREETACPQSYRFLPRVEVRFADPHWEGFRTLQSWANLGGWYEALFSPKVVPEPAGPGAPQGLPALEAIWRWFGRELVYKQVYLKPDRANVPEASPEVARKRYGDCKDFACLFIARARAAGFQGYPVLARILMDPLGADVVAGPPRDQFNHVIAALRLEHSLGLPAEVETPKGRFLLVDPTDPFTPLGRLNEAHRLGHVLICLPGDGQWVSVPDGAILQGGMAIQLDGTVQQNGSLDANLTLEETGNLWGLRSGAWSLNQEAFRAYLERSVLDLPSNGKLEVLAHGDPLALDQPFQVKLHVVDPQAVVLQGSACVMRPPLGLPRLPGPLTLPGKKRRLPVETRGDGRIVFRGGLDLPVPAHPVAAEHAEETSFRSLSWKVTTIPTPRGSRLEFTVEERLKDAFFGLDRLEQGAAAWKQDRALVRALLEDGMAFR